MDQQRQWDDLFAEYAQTRDLNIRNEIIAGHLYIADYVARRFAGRGVEYDDLYQAAALALINAAERYEPGKGATFSTYAVATLTGVLKNYFRDKSRIMRLPRSAAELLPRIESARELLMGELGAEPGVEQIAEKLGLPAEKVWEALEAGNNLRMASLDAPMPDGETDYMEQMGQEDSGYDAMLLHAFIEKEMSKLGETERAVLHARYWQGQSQRQVALELGVSQMYVSRLERRLLERFRHSLLAVE